MPRRPHGPRRTLLSLLALGAAVGACSPSADPIGPHAADEEWAALRSFQERYEDLVDRREQLSDGAYTTAYVRLADEFVTWNDRAGLVPAVVHEGEECDPAAPVASLASIETDPSPSPFPTCAPCPAWPSNAPPGMFCLLVSESCDPFGSRTCTYRCFYIYTHGWL